MQRKRQNSRETKSSVPRHYATHKKVLILSTVTPPASFEMTVKRPVSTDRIHKGQGIFLQGVGQRSGAEEESGREMAGDAFYGLFLSRRHLLYCGAEDGIVFDPIL